MIKIAADPKHLGAKVGITSVLHTWGSAMTHHLRVHMIVPGGGLSPDGSAWVPCRLNFFLSVRVLSRLFRRLFLEGLAKPHAAGKLRFCNDHAGLADPAAFDAFLAPLRKIEWAVDAVVDAKEPLAGPKAVRAFLSRYTHGVAISNSRLICMDDDSVTFRVKNYRVSGARRYTTMMLAPDTFIRRFLIHVLPKGRHRIRHCGFLGNGRRTDNVAKIRDLLQVKAPDEKQKDNSANDGDQNRVLALRCPHCGGRMIIVESFPRGSQPRAPPTQAAA